MANREIKYTPPLILPIKEEQQQTTVSQGMFTRFLVWTALMIHLGLAIKDDASVECSCHELIRGIKWHIDISKCKQSFNATYKTNRPIKYD